MSDKTFGEQMQQISEAVVAIFDELPEEAKVEFERLEGYRPTVTYAEEFSRQLAQHTYNMYFSELNP